jgi:alpha-glucosidase
VKPRTRLSIAVALVLALSPAGTITTPWRVVTVGRDLNTLVNSTILPNLCPPPDPKFFPQGLKTPWIKPGRAVWGARAAGGRFSAAPPKTLFHKTASSRKWRAS